MDLADLWHARIINRASLIEEMVTKSAESEPLDTSLFLAVAEQLAEDALRLDEYLKTGGTLPEAWVEVRRQRRPAVKAAPLPDDSALARDVRKLMALPPFNVPSNIVAHDAYFAMSLGEKYGKDRVAAMEARLRRETR